MQAKTDYFSCPCNYSKLTPKAKRYYSAADSVVIQLEDGSFAEIFPDNHIDIYDNFDVLNEAWGLKV